MATTGVAYRVLARDLCTAIFDGRCPDGTALPTEAVLARQYGVSRQTVRRAFHDLVAEGMVTRVRGRGERDGKAVDVVENTDTLKMLQYESLRQGILG